MIYFFGGREKKPPFLPMTKPKYNPKDQPKYENPPVVEVAIGVTFEKLPNFKLPHTGLFWGKIKSEFPHCEHASPMGSKEEVFDSKISLPIPRIWLINETRDKLIQLQDTRFYFNWRKTGEKSEYPSYDEIKKTFLVHWTNFNKFLGKIGQDPVNITNCELSYINHIPKDQGWSKLSEINKVFPNIDWSKTQNGFLKNPNAISSLTVFPFPDGKGTLTVKIDSGTRNLDSLPIISLEMATKGLGEDKSDDAVWKWFELAHDWIVRGFADLTDLKVQEKIWKRYK